MTDLDFTFIATLRKPEKIKKVKNLTGQKLNRLLALGLLGMTNDAKRRAIWLFKCDCGNVIYAVGNDVAMGNTRSCGCFKSERTKEIFTTHGMRRTREYKKHSDMLGRCFNPNFIQAKDYSERGITVCEYLQDFANFFKELGYLPSRKHSTDRPDNDGGYWCGHCGQCITNGWPKNIRWATPEEQAGNKRNSHLVTIDGETHCLAEWCRITNTEYFKARSRLDLNWTPEETFGLKERANDPAKWLTYNGETLRLTEWARRLGINHQTISARLRAGKTTAEALSAVNR